MKRIGNGRGNPHNQKKSASPDYSGIKKGNLCMVGRIYPNKGGFVVRFGRNLSKWFKHKNEAERFLIGLRYETDKGTFDPRDYHSSKPLSFSNLGEKYLAKKKIKVGHKHYNNLKNYINRAKSVWQDQNIKTIGYAEIEDLLDAQVDISDKTKANMKSCLHDFWKWLLNRRIITRDQFPEFPETPFELGWRPITDITTQQNIIVKVKDISYHINPKIWLGIKWLSVYGIRVRPGEMLKLKEKEINLNMGESGAFIIPYPKEKKPKIIYLIEEDYNILKEIPRGLPDLYFFRHPKGIQGCTPGQKFGDKYLYKWWKRACKELGIENIDLYGGTKHTTVTGASERLTPEQIKRGTGHATNKAFERYFQREARDAVQVYQTINDLQHTYNKKNNQKSAN